jgi:hypothetical protein
MATDQLQNMVRDLRSEAGHSLSVATGLNQLETLKYLLRRTQTELWMGFVWPDIKLRANVDLSPGTYSYPFPTTMSFDQIREAWWAQANSSTWTQVGYGVSEAMIQGDGSNSSRGDPVQYWDTDASGMVRVWPTPASTGYLRFIGNKALAPFVADSDLSTLDSTTIVLLAGAELLARAKAEDADLKQQKAQRHLLKVLGNKISAKHKVSTLGAFARGPAPTPGLDYVPQVG